MTCKEAEIENTIGVNDIKFKKYLNRKPFRKCPNCGIWVEKTRVSLPSLRAVTTSTVDAVKTSATTVWATTPSTTALSKEQTNTRKRLERCGSKD